MFERRCVSFSILFPFSFFGGAIFCELRDLVLVLTGGLTFVRRKRQKEKADSEEEVRCLFLFPYVGKRETRIIINSSLFSLRRWERGAKPTILLNCGLCLLCVSNRLFLLPNFYLFLLIFFLLLFLFGRDPSSVSERALLLLDGWWRRGRIQQ